MPYHKLRGVGLALVSFVDMYYMALLLSQGVETFQRRTNRQAKPGGRSLTLSV